MSWLTVIGVGADGWSGLTPLARNSIESAESVFGGNRLLHDVPEIPGQERIAWTGLDDMLSAIADRQGHRVACLASGDPMWYGLGATLARTYAPKDMTVIPHAGAFSHAAAALGWALADCETLTLHGRPVDRLAALLAPKTRILALSRDRKTPLAVARLLCARGYGESQLVALSELGGPNERRIAATAADWPDPDDCADLNTLAIDCVADEGAEILPRTPGLPDDAFEHDGLITKREARAVTLAHLRPFDGARLWDIGAGSGSIAIEWMRAARRGSAVAVENDLKRVGLITRNALALGVPDLEIVCGTAPAILENTGEMGAAPDSIFIGGGLSAHDLLSLAFSRLRPGGRLVANAVTTDGEQALMGFRDHYGGDLIRFSVSRLKITRRGKSAWSPLAPLTQLIADKIDG